MEKILKISFYLLVNLLALLFFVDVGYATTQQNEGVILEPDKKIDKKVGSNERHIYLVEAKVNQLFKVLVQKRDISITVDILTPSKKVISASNVPSLNHEEEIFFLAEEDGRYQIKLISQSYSSGLSEFSLQCNTLDVSEEERKDYHLASKIVSQINFVMAKQDLKAEKEFVVELEKAFVIWKNYNQLNQQMETLIYIGHIYVHLGDTDKAKDAFNKGLFISEELIRPVQQGVFLNNLAFLYYRSGELEKTLQLFQKCSEIADVNNDKREKVRVVRNIASVNSFLGDYHAAIDSFVACLKVFKELGDEQLEVSTLVDLAVTYTNLCDYQKALDSAEKALILSRKENVRAFTEEQRCLTVIGNCYRSLGNYEKAIDFYNKSLNLAKKLSNKQEQCSTLLALGNLYLGLGEPQKSLEYVQEALSQAEEAKSDFYRANSLNRIAEVYNILGKIDKAISSSNDSLSLSDKFGNKVLKIANLTLLGDINLKNSELVKALHYYKLAFNLVENSQSNQVSIAILSGMANVSYILGKFDEAANYYNESLLIARKIENQLSVSKILLNLTKVKMNMGLLQEATGHFEECREIVENNFQKLTTKSFKYAYASEMQKFYELGVNLYLKKYELDPKPRHDIIALELVEQGRTKVLLQLIKESVLDNGSSSSLDLVRERQELGAILEAKSEYLLRLSNNKKVSENEKKITKKEIDEIANNLEIIEAKIKKENPKYGSLTKNSSLTAKQIQASLSNPNTVLLQYYLRGNKAHLWVISQTNIKYFYLSSVEEIEDLAKNFLDLIKQQPNSTDKEMEGRLKRESKLAEIRDKLSIKLLEPASKDIQNKKLIIIADGILQYLPFASLFEPNTKVPLLVNHEIAYSPSVSLVLLLREGKQVNQNLPSGTLVLADPVFDINDERVAKNDRTINQEDNAKNLAILRGLEGTDISRADLVRLPSTAKEADAILAFSKSKSKLLKGFDANLENLASDIENFAYVHLASHGVINSSTPELSAIVTSLYNEKGNEQDGFLTLNKIVKFKMDAELVALSACKTGLGKEVKGEGIVGLAQAFMYAGTKRVLTSSWSVSDRGTSELMVRFYRNLFVEKMLPTLALRKAQLSMMNDEAWKDPFYWAAFKLEGEWE